MGAQHVLLLQTWPPGQPQFTLPHALLTVPQKGLAGQSARVGAGHVQTPPLHVEGRLQPQVICPKPQP